MLLLPCPPSTAQIQRYMLVLSCVSTALCNFRFICLRLCKPAKGALSSPSVTSLLWPVRERQAKFVRFLVSLTLSEQRWHFQQLSESPGRMVIDIAHAKDLPFSGNSGNSSVLLTLWVWQSGWGGWLCECASLVGNQEQAVGRRSLITEHQSCANHSELGQQLWLLERWNTVKTGLLPLRLLFGIRVSFARSLRIQVKGRNCSSALCIAAVLWRLVSCSNLLKFSYLVVPKTQTNRNLTQTTRKVA